MDSHKRSGFLGMLIEIRESNSRQIQDILSEHGGLIVGRMGLPRLDQTSLSIITLIVHATSDEVGALTGKLGSLPGVSVKSGLAK